jgi:hypothetical protein
MRYILFIFLFVISCSIKDNFKENTKLTEKTESSFSKIDTDKDNIISQEEFIEFKKSKKLADPTVDYKTPLLVCVFILVIVFSLCSLTYIADLLKRIYFYIKNLFVK